MFAGFATLGETLKGAFIVKNSQESPVNADSPPIFKIYGPDGLMQGGTGIATKLDSDAGLYQYAIAADPSNGYAQGMSPVFADAFYFFAILNPNDAAHARARAYAAAHAGPIVTAAWVLTELADGLARTAHRGAFARLVARVQAGPGNVIVPPSEALMARGVQLYDSRPDKQWSLTDCISFVVMQERGITEALTGDHHFEQAGFRSLLK